jgi:hypothetical protein
MPLHLIQDHKAGPEVGSQQARSGHGILMDGCLPVETGIMHQAFHMPTLGPAGPLPSLIATELSRGDVRLI